MRLYFSIVNKTLQSRKSTNIHHRANHAPSTANLKELEKELGISPLEYTKDITKASFESEALRSNIETWVVKEMGLILGCNDNLTIEHIWEQLSKLMSKVDQNMQGIKTPSLDTQSKVSCKKLFHSNLNSFCSQLIQ